MEHNSLMQNLPLILLGVLCIYTMRRARKEKERQTDEIRELQAATQALETQVRSLWEKVQALEGQKGDS